MNNMKDKGVQLVLDKPRTLRYDFNAMIDIDERFEGVDNAIAEMNADDPGRMVKALKTIRYLVYIGLVHEDPELTEEKVGKLLLYDRGVFTEISHEILKAFGIALPEANEASEVKNE